MREPGARRFGASEGKAELKGLERAGAAGPDEGRDTDNGQSRAAGAERGGTRVPVKGRAAGPVRVGLRGVARGVAGGTRERPGGRRWKDAGSQDL